MTRSDLAKLTPAATLAHIETLGADEAWAAYQLLSPPIQEIVAAHVKTDRWSELFVREVRDQAVNDANRRSTEVNPLNSLPMILAAAAFAADKHRGQRRKGAEASPYINHPIAVANLLANEAAITDPITLAAAILHDTIEDTATTAAELSAAFGSEVANVVVEVTDDKTLPKAERKRLQIEHAATISDRAKLVKLADKICNLRDIRRSPPVDWDLARRRQYFDWASQVAAGLRGISPALEALLDAEFDNRPESSIA